MYMTRYICCPFSLSLYVNSHNVYACAMCFFLPSQSLATLPSLAIYSAYIYFIIFL